MTRHLPLLLLLTAAALAAEPRQARKPGNRPSAFLRNARLEADPAPRETVLSAPLPFVPITPCRIVDTRAAAGFTGSFGPPTPSAGSTRTVPVPQSGCGIPATAAAYSINVTVIPPAPLSYITVYPTGSARPLVSTLNSFDGAVVANAAIVPAGTGGAIDFFVTDRTDVVIDINGYFGSASGAVQFYAVAPCRVMDTRAGAGFTGDFGPPALPAGGLREVPIPAGRCAIPATARGYSLNITVVPAGPLAFLTAWPSGRPRPNASTLNSFTGRIVANAAIVPAGDSGAVSVYVTDASDVIIDVNGYLAP